ncbi:MAG: hypothetical protein JO202_16800 [Ktedonobacteraceae bacterium]|nr:hypothetical protein [Ktedonobacteraceae bacterium]
MPDRYTTQLLTLSEAREDDLWATATVDYMRLECAFNADCVIFTRMSSDESPVKMVLLADEVKQFVDAYTAYQQQLAHA